MAWPDAIYTSAGVRAIDACAIERYGVPGYTLMQRAAAAALNALTARFGEGVRLLVVTGGGNNGGDGFVLARLALAAGMETDVVALVEPSRLGGDAATAAADFLSGASLCDDLDGALAAADVVVDAVLGSGLARDVDSEFARVIQAINDSARPVVALDIPSGLDSDSGAVRGVAVQAVLTVTFVAHKAGLWLGAGPGLCGELELATLEIPPGAAADVEPVLRLLNRATAPPLPPRRRDVHKGRAGHVLIVGGNHGMPGAALLAGSAALVAGAGLVTVATRPAHAVAMAMARPELMCVGVEEPAALAPLLEAATVVAVGPGLGRDPWSKGMLAAALGGGPPCVVDADGLNLLPDGFEPRDDWVLTPHPGEAARLLGSSTAAVQGDRVAAVCELQSRYGGVAVLKGVGSLVTAAGRLPAVCTDGTPAMAAPGMGDTLTGLIAALRAQGLGAADAAELGVAAHAYAGTAAARGRDRGLTASAVIAELAASLS
ncbi:MAG: NAD(P)H-hydrate dehydratase [Pseudomonadota bacterium]